MKANEMMIAWTPDEWATDCWKGGQIRVGPWPDMTGWSERYALTTGACESDWTEATDAARKTFVLQVFVAIIVRDKLPPDQVHQAFLSIDEYREALAADIKGSTHYGQFF